MVKQAADIMDGVHLDLIIGASTEIIAGGRTDCHCRRIDTHIHFICPKLIGETALYGGVTTLIGVRTGPADGTNATTCTSGAWNMARMLEAALMSFQ